LNLTRGDLRLRIELKRHSTLKAINNNLIFNALIDPWYAALGKTITVPTLEGPDTIDILPGFIDRQFLKMPNKGIYNENGYRGDLNVLVKLKVRAATTRRAIELWEQLREETK
tara:strand:- start:16 stop:354 length:339 start_codon:yes stop_codon:yes gene_type:complete